MAAFDEAIDPMIRECAMEEFLEKGFTNASLRSICAQAGITTGALYKRYGSKEELFQALVQATIDDIDEVVASKSVDYSLMTDEQLYGMWTLTEGYMGWWFEFMINHREGFTLLVKCSDGTKHQDFQHQLVEKICQETYKCYRAAVDRGLARGDITPRELHVLTTAFWSTMFEPFVHGFTDEEIRLHCQLTIQFIDWHRALGFRERKA